MFILIIFYQCLAATQVVSRPTFPVLHNQRIINQHEARDEFINADNIGTSDLSRQWSKTAQVVQPPERYNGKSLTDLPLPFWQSQFAVHETNLPASSQMSLMARSSATKKLGLSERIRTTPVKKTKLEAKESQSSEKSTFKGRALERMAPGRKLLGTRSGQQESIQRPKVSPSRSSKSDTRSVPPSCRDGSLHKRGHSSSKIAPPGCTRSHQEGERPSQAGYSRLDDIESQPTRSVRPDTYYLNRAPSIEQVGVKGKLELHGPSSSTIKFSSGKEIYHQTAAGKKDTLQFSDRRHLEALVLSQREGGRHQGSLQGYTVGLTTDASNLKKSEAIIRSATTNPEFTSAYTGSGTRRMTAQGLSDNAQVTFQGVGPVRNKVSGSDERPRTGHI